MANAKKKVKKSAKKKSTKNKKPTNKKGLKKRVFKHIVKMSPEVYAKIKEQSSGKKKPVERVVGVCAFWGCPDEHPRYPGTHCVGCSNDLTEHTVRCYYSY